MGQEQILYKFSYFLQALEKVKNISTKICDDIPPCYSTDYAQLEMASNQYQDEFKGKFEVNIQFRETFVESINMQSSYDAQNLISEIGGIMGLFLGLSGLEFLLKIPKKGHHLATLAMWLCFVHWSVEGFFKYIQKPLSTEVSMRQADVLNEFPLLTLCPNYHSFDEYNGKQCWHQFFKENLNANNFSGFYDGLENALK